MKEYKNKKKILNFITILIILIITIYVDSTNVKADNDTIISKGNWEEWQKEDYWEWHTRTTTDDKAYNGNHIVIENDVIDFFGYWKNSYKDFLYKDYKKSGKKIFKFRIDESKANYHTLDGAGFIFNANKQENKLSGYILIFRQKDVCLYRIEDIDIEKFETTGNTTIATYGELIETVPKINNQIHDLIVEVTPTNIKITEEQTEILNQDLDYSKHVGDSFGLISSYVQHACSILTKIEFSQLEVIIEDYEISILNTDTEGRPISGGYFELKDKDGNIIQEGKTNKDGKFIVKGLQEGIYTIQQKIAPLTYILNDEIYTFKVTREGKVVDEKTNEEIDVIVENEKEEIEAENKETTDNNKRNNTIDSNEVDNTIKNSILPFAGERTWIIFAIIFLISISIGLIFKLKKYKIVKY